jgi:hypothetical protein
LTTTLHRRGPFADRSDDLVEGVKQASGFWAVLNEVPERLRRNERVGA